jgi:hypothetical protein
MDVTRGAAVGDLDNDGRADVVFVNIEGPVQVLLDRLDNDAHWLALQLVDDAGRGHIVGAIAWLLEEGEPGLRRRARADGSYASAQDPRILFGLGDDGADRTVRIRWPDGAEEDFRALAADRYHVLRQGTGAPSAEP